MFTKSRTDKAREQAADAASTAADAANSAAGSLSEAWRGKVAPTVGAKARDARDWAAPHVEHGRKAAAPKVEAARDAAVEKVTPAVDAAREKVAPAVDAARDRIEDLLPRLVEAVAAAAAAGSAASSAAGEYRSRSGDAVAVLRGEAVAKRRRGRVLRKLLLLPVIAGAVAAGYAVFKSRTPKEDPWALPTGTYPAYTPPSPATVDLSSGQAADALDDAGVAEVPGLDVQTSTSPEPTDPTAPTDRS